MATNAVVSAFQVLEAVSTMQPVGLSDLARKVELPKSTVQRSLLTLAEVGWLTASPTKPTRWSLTYRAFSVGSRARDQQSIRETALPYLNELQLSTTETIHLTAPDGNELVLIERLDTPHPLRAFLPLGIRIPLHASASGLAFLAASGDDYVDEYIDGGLVARTENTVTDPEVLRDVIATIRHRGYAINDQGLSSGITALGAAIVNNQYEPIGSVSVSGPTSRMTNNKFDEYGTAALDTAQRIHAAL